MNRHLLLMVKTPAPGRVKTRLVPPLTPEEASALYTAMLDDLVRRCRRATDYHIHVALSPADSDTTRFPSSWHVFAQVEGDLGRRLTAAYHAVRDQGAEAIVALGVDSPTLPWAYVAQAFRQLQRADVVLGPTDDGGCYAIGVRNVTDAWLTDIAWGTSAVCQQLTAQAHQHRLRVRQLPPWHDIDTITDLCTHRHALLRTRCAPRTRAWLWQRRAALFKPTVAEAVLNT